MDERLDLLEEIAHAARGIVDSIRESYDVGDLDEDVDEALEDLVEKLEAFDEFEDSDDEDLW